MSLEFYCWCFEISLEWEELRGIDVCVVVDLVVLVFMEWVYTPWYSVNVEMGDYIGQGIFRVLSYIMCLFIRFQKCIIKVWHDFIQHDVWFWELMRQWELNIKKCKFLILIDKYYLFLIQLVFGFRMVFCIILWWFFLRIVFQGMWHGFFSGFRYSDRCQLFVCTPNMYSGWIPDKDAVNRMGETILVQMHCLRYDWGYRQWPLLAMMELWCSKY